LVQDDDGKARPLQEPTVRNSLGVVRLLGGAAVYRCANRLALKAALRFAERLQNVRTTVEERPFRAA